MEVAIAAGYSRIPVYEQGIDDIAGVVFTKDLMRAERDGRSAMEVRTLVRPAHFVPETKRVHELMREMQKEKFHIAIVTDEYGSMSGLVTLEDLLEELVGEITDEYDLEEPEIAQIGESTYRVSGKASIERMINNSALILRHGTPSPGIPGEGWGEGSSPFATMERYTPAIPQSPPLCGGSG